MAAENSDGSLVKVVPVNRARIDQGPVSTYGIDRLVEFNQTGNGMDIDPDSYLQPMDYNPLIRGKKTPMVASLSGILSNDIIVRWIQLDRSGFLEAAAKDRHLRGALAHIGDLSRKINESDQHTDEQFTPLQRYLHTRAATEKTAEIVTLAKPYIPRSLKKQFDDEKKPKEPPKPRDKKDRRERAGRDRDRDERNPYVMFGGLMIPLWLIPQHLMHLFKDANPGFGIEMPDDFKGSGEGFSGDGFDLPESIKTFRLPLPRIEWSKYLAVFNDTRTEEVKRRHRRRRVTIHDGISSPLMFNGRKVGRGSFSEGDLGEVQLTGKEMMHGIRPDSFVITKIMNEYDRETDTLTVNAPAQPLLLHPAHAVGTEISTPLGSIGRSESINIPTPVSYANRFRHHDYNYNDKYPIVRVDLTDEENEVVVGSEELAPYMRIDGLGNRFLSVDEMPFGLIAKAMQKPLVMHTQLQRSCDRDIADIQAQWIEAVPEEEEYRLNLLPPEIAKFVKTMLNAKAEAVKHKDEKDPKAPRRGVHVDYKDNTQIFSIMSQFLGNYWLNREQNPEEDIAEEDDPVAYGLVERVLRHGSATQSEANIVLGQLMRYFLGPREGIAYVEGFAVNKVGRRQTQNLELRVLHKAADGSTHIYDANPWDDETYDKFYDRSDDFKVAAQEWYSVTPELRKGPSILLKRDQTIRAKEAHERVLHSWTESPRASTEVRKALVAHDMHANLPGSVDLNEVIGLIDSVVIEQKSRLALPRWVPFVKRDEPEATRSLVPFLQDYFQVDRDLRGRWSQPEYAIDGTIDFDFRLLDVPLYKGSQYTSKELYQYTSFEDKSRLIEDPKVRAQTFDAMSRVMMQALLSSEQNITVFNQLAQYVDLQARRYANDFILSFARLDQKLGMGADEFFNAAPFLLLLKHPLKDLQGFFHRSFDRAHPGFLEPGTDQMKVQLDLALTRWRAENDTAMEQINRIISRAPVTESREVVPYEVPSLMLWDTIGQQATNGRISEEPQFYHPYKLMKHIKDTQDLYRELLAKQSQRGDM